MDLDTYSNWIEENIEAEEYEGIPMNPMTKSDQSWLRTGIKTHSVYNGTGGYVGTLSTEAKWLVNSRQQILNYGTVTFEYVKARPSISANKSFSSGWMASNNLKLNYQVDFVEWSGAHSIIHVYNLHGNGDISFRVVN